MDRSSGGASARSQALALLDVLDTPTEQAFDDIVFIAAEACDTPIALVSLLDGERQWFKARVGLDVRETPIDQSVCRIEVDAAEYLEIADLSGDARTAANPLVSGERAFRFYAGVPLTTRDGTVIGRLCVIDVEPRREGLDATQRALLAALARQVSDQLELRRIAGAGRRLIALQAGLMEIGDVVRRAGSVGEMTRAAAAIVGRLLAVDRAGFGVVDAATEVVEIEPDWTAPGVASIAGRHRFADFGAIRDELARGEPLVIDDVLTDHRTAPDPTALTKVAIGALVNMPVRAHGAIIAVFIVHSTAARRWTEDELAFLRNVADRLEAGVSRQRLEERQRVVNGEISHRLKNMLAMVQAIATHTLRGVAERGPIRTFEQRLVALSNAHDILMQRTWTEADIGAVARGSIAGFGGDERVTCAGPPVSLGARAALSFALLVHELLTNAVKYGSLSVEDGRVELTWSVNPGSLDASGVDEMLTVRWRESGGPAVVPPSSKGFGSRLINLGLLGTGGVSLRYEPAGLEADLRAAVSLLAEA